MGFSQQEYGSGLPFPSPGDRPHPGIEPIPTVSSALAGGFFTTEPPGKPRVDGRHVYCIISLVIIVYHLAFDTMSTGCDPSLTGEEMEF